MRLLVPTETKIVCVLLTIWIGANVDHPVGAAIIAIPFCRTRSATANSVRLRGIIIPGVIMQHFDFLSVDPHPDC